MCYIHTNNPADKVASTRRAGLFLHEELRVRADYVAISAGYHRGVAATVLLLILLLFAPSPLRTSSSAPTTPH